jgi:hypothetical protein
MTTTRWKMTAGGLVLALGGLAAVAGVPARSCQADHKAGSAPLVEVPPVPAPVVRTAHQAPAEPVIAPAVAATPEPPKIPAVSTPAEASVIPLPVAHEEPKPTPKSEPKPAPKEEKVFELKVPTADVTPPVIPEPKTEAKPTPKPAADTLPLPEPTTAAAPPAPLLPPVAAKTEPKPAPAPVKAEPTPAPAPADPLLNAKPDPAPSFAGEKKLKVMLQMGDGQPRFEVRDGDVIYLKVVCDKVDVKSPSDRGETMSTLRASNRVTFVTPGGEGTCDELTVIPGTGQVVVAGHVSFKYNWGKVETTVSGEKMTFRLGSTPGVAGATFQAVSHQTR